MISKLLEIGKSVGLWLSNKPNRLRMRGSRIEIIALILTRLPNPSVLLGQSPYHKMWMPPQEGVNQNESFISALRRCLRDECGLPITEGEETLGPAFYLRSIRFTRVIPLPPGRQGERLVADNVAGTPLESVILRSKAYWLATILVKHREAIVPKADGSELLAIKWFDLEEAEREIKETNHSDKADLLLKCFQDCRKDLFGAAIRGQQPHAPDASNPRQ